MTAPVPQVLAVLSASSTVTASLGNRITPAQAIQNQAFPYAVLTPTNIQPENTLAGFGGLDICEVQVDIWANSFTQADSVATDCRRALEAAGILCLRQVTDFFDGSMDPGAYRAGYVFRVFN